MHYQGGTGLMRFRLVRTFNPGGYCPLTASVQAVVTARGTPDIRLPAGHREEFRAHLGA